MKKDFFGGAEEEEVETIYSYCGETRCLDPAVCGGCCQADLTARRTTANNGNGAVSEAGAGGGLLPPQPNLIPMDWGYKPDNGPHLWHRQFPIAALGRFQSPIDLRECDLLQGGGGAAALPALLTCFQPAAGLAVENTGASWQINWPQDDTAAPACVLRGGPLCAGDAYNLLQMHAHWGAVPGRGSEHTLEGRSLDGELHLVFYNTTKYQRPEEAMEAPDGLAVVAMLLCQQNDAPNGSSPSHPEIEKITRSLSAVRRRGEVAPLEAALSPNDLLPSAGQRAYFTYPGSLTAPPLYESVTWIVMRQQLGVSAQQLDMMRDMRSGFEDDSCPLVDNFRPTCCLGLRPVRVGH